VTPSSLVQYRSSWVSLTFTRDRVLRGRDCSSHLPFARLLSLYVAPSVARRVPASAGRGRDQVRGIRLTSGAAGTVQTRALWTAGRNAHRVPLFEAKEGAEHGSETPSCLSDRNTQSLQRICTTMALPNIARVRKTASYKPMAFRPAHAPRPFRRGDLALVLGGDSSLVGQMVVVCMSDRGNDSRDAEIARPVHPRQQRSRAREQPSADRCGGRARVRAGLRRSSQLHRQLRAHGPG
jgi:hypothetical protein